jgi:hypothetical protein
VLAALAHRLRARSERQQLLTERLRSGELRPGALADLAELAAAARRGVRDGDHILVMAGAAEPDRSNGGGSMPLGQALSAAVAASEAASRTVVPPTPSVSLEPFAAPVFGQILAELLAHATAATAPGERLEIHTRWGPDGGLVLELLSPRPVPTRTPVDELDRMLAAGRPDGPVAPQEIGLYLAARLARAIGGRLGLRGSPGVASAPGPSPVAVLQMPPSVLAGSRSAGEDGDARSGADRLAAPAGADPPGAASGADPLGTPGGADPLGTPAGAAAEAPADSDPAEEPTTTTTAAPAAAAAPSGPSAPQPASSAPSLPPMPQAPTEPESPVPPWPPVPLAEAGTTAAAGSPANSPPSNGLPSHGTAPEPGSAGDTSDAPSGSGIARLPVPPAPSGASGPSGPPQAPPPERPQLPFPPAAHTGPPPGPSGAGLQIPPGPRGPGRSTSAGPGGPQPPGPNGPGPSRQGPPLPGLPTPNRPGGQRPEPLETPPPTEALPVSGTTPPVELFGPFDSEVPVPVDDLDGTPIFAAVASAWFRDPGAAPIGAPGSPGAGSDANGHRPGEEPANWSTAGDAEFEAARNRADRVVEPPVNANGLPMRRPGQQMVPPARRDNPPAAERTPRPSERQPDRVRNRLASYQRGLREGRHRAAEESSNTNAGADLNGATPHGRNGHAAG